MKPLFAFWRYDLYPYLLGAEVRKDLSPNGSIQPEGYGGHRFNPIKFLPLKEGQELYAKIKQLKDEHRKAQIAFDKEWLAKLNELVPFAKDK